MSVQIELGEILKNINIHVKRALKHFPLIRDTDTKNLGSFFIDFIDAEWPGEHEAAF